MTDEAFKAEVRAPLDTIEARLAARDARMDPEAIRRDQEDTDSAIAAARAHLANCVSGLIGLYDEPPADLLALSHRLPRPQQPSGGN